MWLNVYGYFKRKYLEDYYQKTKIIPILKNNYIHILHYLLKENTPTIICFSILLWNYIHKIDLKSREKYIFFYRIYQQTWLFVNKNFYSFWVKTKHSGTLSDD